MPATHLPLELTNTPIKIAAPAENPKLGTFLAQSEMPETGTVGMKIRESRQNPAAAPNHQRCT
jgi:hypothetical protein